MRRTSGALNKAGQTKRRQMTDAAGEAGVDCGLAFDRELVVSRFDKRPGLMEIVGQPENPNPACTLASGLG